MKRFMEKSVDAMKIVYTVPNYTDFDCASFIK